jgi:hydroxymethylbilane synthase
VTAERALLAAMGGGCQVPLGAHATVDGPALQMRAVIVSPDGATLIRREARGVDALVLGSGLAEEMLSAGGREILQAVYGR